MQGFEPRKKDAREGGVVAGRTRRGSGERSGKPVASGGDLEGLTGKGREAEAMMALGMLGGEV